MTPEQITTSWQSRQGLVTIWPTHLVHDLAEVELSTRVKAQTAPLLVDLPTNTEIMGVASSLFDFFNNFTEPLPETITPGKEVDTLKASPDTEESPTFVEKPTQLDDEPEEDDLFSTRSETPGPAEFLHPPVPEEADYDDLFEELPEDLDDDVVIESPPRSAEPNVQNVDADIEFDGGEEINVITEDDFNFFDSPAVGIGDDAGGGNPSAVIAAPVEVVDDEKPEHPADAAADDHGVDRQSNGEVVAVVDPPNLVRKPSLFPTTKPTELRPVRLGPDHIPSAFEPLILSSTDSPTFTYNLPTPAPTPEAFRPDLLVRLRQNKKAEVDYGADWEGQSDTTDAEDEVDSYPDAPLTPESKVDDKPPIMDADFDGDGEASDQVKFGGSTCVGAEWFGLRHDLTVLNALILPWSSGWADTTVHAAVSNPPTSITQPETAWSIPTSLDYDRLATEVIANRFFRSIFGSRSLMGGESGSQSSLEILEAGVQLQDLAKSDGSSDHMLQS